MEDQLRGVPVYASKSGKCYVLKGWFCFKGCETENQNNSWVHGYGY